MSGKKLRPHPKAWRGKVVRILHDKAGGAMYGAQNIILMMRMEEKLTTVKIKTWESWTVSGCLYERVGGKQVHPGKPDLIRDIVFW